ncbi:MAG: hypothetical protein U1E65_00655 [Myxococcota bacterium]
MRWALVALFALGSGCGGTSPGGGTRTLYVEATSTGKPDGTEFVVLVLKGGNNVPGANVFLEDRANGKQTNLVGHGDPSKKKGEYRYEGRAGYYVESLRLKVTVGDDSLEAALDGPHPHLITRPGNNDIIAAATGEALGVEWSRNGLADRVHIRPEGVPEVVLEQDPGQTTVPLGPLKSGDQKLEVARENQVTLAGGTEGSVWKASYGVENRFTLQR